MAELIYFKEIEERGNVITLHLEQWDVCFVISLHVVLASTDHEDWRVLAVHKNKSSAIEMAVDLGRNTTEDLMALPYTPFDVRC